MDNTLNLGHSEVSQNESIPKATKTEDNSDEDQLHSENESSSQLTTISPGTSVCSIYRHKKKGIESKIEKYVDSYDTKQQKKQKCDEDEGDDINFFKSLLPVVQPWPLQEKLKFRIEVMNLAMGYAERNRALSAVYKRRSNVFLK